jgi:ketosteroid isomerase-like protein
MAVSDDVRKAMQGTNERFCREVVGEGKFDAIDQVYTAGARILPPGAPIMEGREAIKGFWQTGIAALGITGAKLMTLDVEMAGNTAVEIGEAELQLGENGAALAKYIVHWKQEDGRWLWDKDIWNMN